MQLEAALDQFVEASVTAWQATHGGLARIPDDPDWPSACYQGEADAAGLRPWRPVRQGVATDLFERLAAALGHPVHEDIARYYQRYWSDPLPARAPQGDLDLLLVWNEEDLERLRANLIGHLLDCRRQRRPDAFFFACTHPEDYVLSVRNDSGRVVLEEPGRPGQDVLAEDLGAFLATLEPRID